MVGDNKNISKHNNKTQEKRKQNTNTADNKNDHVAVIFWNALFPALSGVDKMQQKRY